MLAHLAVIARIPISETKDLTGHYDEAIERVAERLAPLLRGPAVDYVNTISSFGATPKVPPLLDLCLERLDRVQGINRHWAVHRASFGSMRGAGLLQGFHAFMIGRYRRGLVAHDVGPHVDLFLLDREQGAGLVCSNYRSRLLRPPLSMADVLDTPAMPVEDVDFARLVPPATVYARNDDGWLTAVDVR